VSSGSSHRRSMASKKQEERNVGSSPQKEEQSHELNEDKIENKKRDLSSLPGYELLSERERKLCCSLSLKPSHYITFKTVLLKDYVRRKQGVPSKVPYPAGLDKSDRRRIINFLVNSGWISAFWRSRQMWYRRVRVGWECDRFNGWYLQTICKLELHSNRWSVDEASCCLNRTLLVQSYKYL